MSGVNFNAFDRLRSDDPDVNPQIAFNIAYDKLYTARKRVENLEEQRNNIFKIYSYAKEIEECTESIKENGMNVCTNIGDVLPDFEKLYNMDNELGNNNLLNSDIVDYMEDLKYFAAEIDKEIARYTTMISHAKSQCDYYSSQLRDIYNRAYEGTGLKYEVDYTYSNGGWAKNEYR